MGSHPLTTAERSQGQRAAIFYNLLGNLRMAVLCGPILMLYATDVLGFTATAIAGLLALFPAIGILRIFALPHIRRLGQLKTLRFATILGLLVIVLILALPASLFQGPHGFTYFLLILIGYAVTQRIGLASIWQPILLQVTTDEDRGRFFARMRFWFTLVTTAIMAII
ncbi:MAG: hypothetical protein ACYTGH_21545, partial [Planctomycetota bacterium]